MASSTVGIVAWAMGRTKYEVYDALIAAGIGAGFKVAAEFDVRPAFETAKRQVDLVWCVDYGATGLPWMPVGAFEIEGHDAELRKPGRLSGIEKDADSILSVARFVRARTGVDVAPAAAVVLFERGYGGGHWNRAVRMDEVDDRRARFAAHADLLIQTNAPVLPPDIRSSVAAETVVLGRDLDRVIPRLVARAQSLAQAIAALG